MFNIIKNAINIENISFDKKNNVKVKKEFLDLTYDIKTECLIDKNSIPVLNTITFNRDFYNEILNKTVSALGTNGLWVNKITIKNTGNVPIKYENFYQNDKLGFENSPSIIAIQVNSKITKKYINTELNIEDDFINIKFDTIEVGDLIELNIISHHEMCYIKLLGKTQNFDNPNMPNKYENSSSKQNKILDIIVVFLLILGISMIVFSKYIGHKNLGLYIRSPFIVKEIQTNK